MGQTISVSVGRVAIDHDIRATISNNVDPSLIHQDETFIDKLKDFNYDVVAYTNAKFQTDIDELNAKQKRADRKINTTYVEYLEAKNQKLIERAAKNKAEGINKSVRKPTPLVHEYVLQFGNHETNGTLTTDIEMNRRALKRVIKAIERDYPHVDILLCTFHADEPNGTPHAHLLVQFTGEGYTRGLKREISMNKALECDGIARSNTRGEYSITKWVETLCDDYMEPVLEEEFGEEREYVNDSREHLPTPIFRQKAKEEAQEIARQKAELGADRYATQKSRRELAKQETEIDSKLNSLQNLGKSVKNEITRLETMYNAGDNTRASRMATFMGGITFKDGSNLYQRFQAREPEMIQQEERARVMMRDKIDRELRRIESRNRQLNNDHDHDMNF